MVLTPPPRVYAGIAVASMRRLARPIVLTEAFPSIPAGSRFGRGYSAPQSRGTSPWNKHSRQGPQRQSPTLSRYRNVDSLTSSTFLSLTTHRFDLAAGSAAPESAVLLEPAETRSPKCVLSYLARERTRRSLRSHRERYQNAADL